MRKLFLLFTMYRGKKWSLSRSCTKMRKKNEATESSACSSFKLVLCKLCHVIKKCVLTRSVGLFFLHLHALSWLNRLGVFLRPCALTPDDNTSILDSHLHALCFKCYWLCSYEVARKILIQLLLIMFHHSPQEPQEEISLISHTLLYQ